MILTIVKLTLALIAIIIVTGEGNPAKATSAMRRRAESCTFDQGSAVLTSTCQSELKQVATCWTRPRTIFWISPDNEKFRVEQRSFYVEAFAASDEGQDISPELLALKRGSNILGYLASLGIPHDRIKLHAQQGDFRANRNSQLVRVTGCLEYNYRSTSEDSSQRSSASTVTRLACPLLGEAADYPTSYSYSSFGQSLDFEPLVMGMIRASPHELVHCSDTPLPIYRNYRRFEIMRLRALVKTPLWKQQVEHQNLFYLQAYIQQILGEADITVAQSLLQAVWSAKPESRTLMLTKAMPSGQR